MVRIAEETGRSSVTVGEWRDKENFPDKRGLDTALSRYFGAAPEWITDGKGTPPQPDLWTMWLRLRALRRAPADAKDALDLLDEKRKRS